MRRSAVVGIDEAGYGPLLGPLVVSAVVFDVPVSIMQELKDPAAGPDFWTLLRTSITPKPGRRDARLAVADSKKLHGQRGSTRGITLLERAALTFLNLADQPPTTLQSMLGRLCPEAVDKLSQYPWYADMDVMLPTGVTPDDLATQRNALLSALATTGIRFRGVWSEVLPEGHFNRLVANTHNKAVVLFGLSVRLIQRIADTLGPRPLRVWVDRQGGRTGYRRPLMTAFEDARLEVVEESPARSSYRLTRRPAPWMVRFVQSGESHHLPIALASIFSKYLRELLMGCFNRYWATHVQDLRPTGGYYKDGQRFLADIGDAVIRLGIQREWLVRSL